MRRKTQSKVWISWGTWGSLLLFLNITELHLNKSESLPHGFFLVIKNLSAKTGQYVSFQGHQPHYMGYAPPCIKEVAGLPGDVYEVYEKNFYINGVLKGSLRRQTKDGRPLTSLKTRTIPEGYVFVKGQSYDTYDSRYEEFGLVKETHLKGRAFGFFKRQRHD